METCERALVPILTPRYSNTEAFPVIGMIPVVTGQRWSYMCSRLIPPPVAIEESGLPGLFSHPEGKGRKARDLPARKERSFKDRSEGGNTTGWPTLRAAQARARVGAEI